MVFQNYALYPHMTVRENLEFPLKLRHMGKEENVLIPLSLEHLTATQWTQIAAEENEFGHAFGVTPPSWHADLASLAVPVLFERRPGDLRPFVVRQRFERLDEHGSIVRHGG